MKKEVLNKLLIVFGILIIISVHADAADVKLSPGFGIGFQGSESSEVGDHTSYIRNLDGTWGPPTSANVPFDYYATGLDSRFWDALSLRFNTGTYSPSEYKAVLRFYAQRGGYDDQWNHYIILQGDKNPTYQDADWEAVANDPNVKSLGGSGGSWFEEELPDSYWNSDSFWVTLRMWNVRVDAVELSLISKVTPSITVTSPNGGEVWVHGSTHDITWTSSGDAGSNVKIELLKGGSVYRTLANTLNDGSCSWTLLDAEGTGGDYRVRITSSTNAAITDTSNGYFTITSPNPPSSITVTSPNGGEVWVHGSTHDITWTSSGDAGSNVKIELLKGGSVYRTLANTLNDGSCSWTLLDAEGTGGDYRVRITSTSNPAIYDVSDTYFTITSAATGSITVVEPNTDSYWWWDSQFSIRWTYTGNPGSMVNIILIRNGVEVAPIATVPLGSNGAGSYAWKVPRNIGDSYEKIHSIRVQSTTQPSISDDSDNFRVSHQWHDDAIAFMYGNLISPSKEIGTNVRILTQTPNTYYAALSWDVGYYGIQSEGGNPSQRHVHLTVWDYDISKPTQVIFKDSDVTCKSDRSEGSAQICTWNYNWIQDHDYKLVIKAENVGETTQYQALFYPDETSQPKHIATLAYQRKDAWINQITSFIEDFAYPGYPQHCGSLYYRSVLFGKGYRKDLSDTVFPLNSATYSPNGGCGNRNANVQYFNIFGYFFGETGSGVVERITPNSILNIITPQPGHITVNSPNGGETLLKGSVHQITWSSAGIVGSNVKIEILKGNAVIGTFANTINDGAYTWTLLSSYATGTDYKIRITSLTYPEISDTSDNSFIIADRVAPVADFSGSPVSGTAPLSVVFTDQSTGTAITNHHWDFGDGTIANYDSKTNPTHRYTNAGAYSVTLTVTNAGGSGTRTRPDYITVTSIPVTLEATQIGIFRPSTGRWYFDTNLDGFYDKSFRFGNPTDQVIAGDWDGDEKDGIALFRPSTGFWYFDNNLDGFYDKSFRFGNPTDRIIAGDWDGDKKDGIALFRPSTGRWYFDTNLDGFYDKSFRFGNPTDQVIAGDWDGDEKDGIALFRHSTGFWYFDNNLDGFYDKSFRFGNPTDQVIAGDWDGDKKDGIALFRPSTGRWYFDTNLDGFYDKSFRFGNPTDQVIAGDWDGDEKDGIALFRHSTGFWYFDNNLDGFYDKSFRFGNPTDQVIAGDWN